MFPKGFTKRTSFIGGKQSEVTPRILKISNKFKDLEFPDGFILIHNYLFEILKILPYNENTKEYERKRRWKLTADEVLQTGTIVDTKYCNDVVNLFLAIMKGLGFEAKLVKVFKYNNELFVHSLALVFDIQNDKKYLIDTGLKEIYWVEELSTTLVIRPKTSLPRGWFVWKIADDQWSMNLYDYSQERKIVRFAEKFLNKTNQKNG